MRPQISTQTKNFGEILEAEKRRGRGCRVTNHTLRRARPQRAAEATLLARSYTVPVLRGRRLYALTAKPVARHSREHTHASHASQCSGDRPRHRHYSTRTRSSRARRRRGEPQAQGGGGCAIRCTRRDGAVLLSPPHPPPSLTPPCTCGARLGSRAAWRATGTGWRRWRRRRRRRRRRQRRRRQRRQ